MHHFYLFALADLTAFINLSLKSLSFSSSSLKFPRLIAGESHQHHNAHAHGLTALFRGGGRGFLSPEIDETSGGGSGGCGNGIDDVDNSAFAAPSR